MLKYFSLLFIFLAPNCGQSTAQAPVKPGKTYAVVIGISAYKSKALPMLQYADKDAGMFAAWLQSKAGGSVPGSQIKLLRNEEATIGAVYDALDWLRDHCGSQDLGYIYFSGHGDVETKNTFSLGYLLAYNTPPNNYRNNAIRIEDLNSKANTLSIKNKAKVILITDACHSGKLAGDFYKGKQLVAQQLRLVLNNEVRLTSCATDEEAAEGPDWGGGRGVFSYYLLMGLNGLADLKKDGTIQLQEITGFLDSSLASDKYLIANKHKQHPVTDGNPYFPLAITDSATLNELHAKLLKDDSEKALLPAGLQSFKAIGPQPIDYFFSLAQIQPVENYLDFDSYTSVAPEALPLQILDDRILYQQELDTLIDSLRKAGTDYNGNEFANLDSLKLLRNQLLKNKSLINRFNERFVEMVHEKGQEMINAYLEGDLTELEKRQYYYNGNRQYRDFLSMLKCAIQVVPPNHSLAALLKVNYSYLSGLIDRLEMATGDKADSLLNRAFVHQRMALQLEPYAAYIHNELGNLYLHKKRFDSATYHFNLASALSPTWSVPWSNKIRLNLAINKLDKAKEAIHIADSLQPNLAYVMMNAGLVMERDSNWLAAESFFKKAIAQNKVHFLPYERLGKIYLFTGEYAKADSFLFDAKLRKDEFAVNDRYFEFGPELGGPPQFNDEQQQEMACGQYITTSPKKIWQPYLSLLRAIGGGLATDSMVQMIGGALQQVPDIPLAHHYLGKQFFQQQKWQAAVAELLQAVANYRFKTDLWAQLKRTLYPGDPFTTDTCLLQAILAYHYDVLEDHYLLAALYEKQDVPAKAVTQYNIISAIENKRQADQADNNGFSERFKNLQEHPGEGLEDVILREYEQPVRMGGAIKLARLQEKLGEYLQAEKVLLNQVSLNRLAGNKRQQALQARKPGTWQMPGGSRFNFYWLSVNRDMESETYNFYRRMMELFPRDFEWKEKAGLFLYSRLALAFNQMQVNEFGPFYESIGRYAYPWLSGEEPPNDSDIRFNLPGTHEKLSIEMPVYDPLKQSLEYLRQSVKLSGDLKPGREILEALADLNAWTGDMEAAIPQYQELLKLQPANATARNKLINVLVASLEFPEARVQLNAAFNRKQIKPQQIQLLAEYDMLAGNFKDAGERLKDFQPRDDFEKYQVMALYARINWLSGGPKKALGYLLDSFPILKPGQQNKAADLELNDLKKGLAGFRRYSIARMYVLLKNSDKALGALKQALDSGFNFKYVLDNDPAWAALRNTQKWNALIKNYDFTVDYPTQTLKTSRAIDMYRIPHYHD